MAFRLWEGSSVSQRILHSRIDVEWVARIAAAAWVGVSLVVDEFGAQGSEEARRHCVVPQISLAAHALPCATRAQCITVVLAGVRASAIGMVRDRVAPNSFRLRPLTPCVVAKPNYYEIMPARRALTREGVVGFAHHRAVTDPTKKQSVHSGAWHELVGRGVGPRFLATEDVHHRAAPRTMIQVFAPSAVHPSDELHQRAALDGTLRSSVSS